MTRDGAAAPVPVRPTMDLSDVRRHHLSVVLEHLVRNGPRSRAAIAQDTGLTKATVSSLIADLDERGLVDEVDTPRDGRPGRPATDVAAAGHRVGALGLQIEVDEVAACLLDLAGEQRAVRRSSGSNAGLSVSQVLRRLRDVTAGVLAEADAQGIYCVGGTLAVPGLVDPGAPTVRVAPNLGWLDTDLSDLAVQLDLPPAFPIAVDNEANLGALAELRHGAGRHIRSFVYVSIGRGVGAGVVVDGTVLRGSHGFAGELGHVVVDSAGERCACGARGCLETIVGTGRPTPPSVIAAALAAALRTVVHLVDPEAVVLGGSLGALDDAVVAEVGERLAASTLGSRAHACPVHRSTLGPDAALVGAATAALDPVIADPTTILLPARSQPA